MAIPFSLLRQHTNVANTLYRTLLRNVIHLEKINSQDRLNLIRKIRYGFRYNSSSINSLLVQRQLKTGVWLNDLIVDSYNDDSKFEILLSKIKSKTLSKEIKNVNDDNNYIYNQSINDELKVKDNNKLSNKIRKNPFYSALSDDEILEFRQTKEIELPESTKFLLPNIHIHSQWFFNVKQYPPIKFKIDKRYLRTILPSMIAYEKQKYYFDKLSNKLNNPPSHKLRRISGTGHWIYIINTPWNRDLRTENFKFIGDIRRKYDDLIVEIQECEKFYKNNEKLFMEEEKWEKLIGTSNASDNSENWDWLFKEAENYYKKKKYNIESEVAYFCKRQGLIYEKIKPLFDEMHNHSKSNLEILKLELTNIENGPFTDIIDGGLGSKLKKYGFRDPLETHYLKTIKKPSQKSIT